MCLRHLFILSCKSLSSTVSSLVFFSSFFNFFFCCFHMIDVSGSKDLTFFLFMCDSHSLKTLFIFTKEHFLTFKKIFSTFKRQFLSLEVVVPEKVETCDFYSRWYVCFLWYSGLFCINLLPFSFKVKFSFHMLGRQKNRWVAFEGRS